VDSRRRLGKLAKGEPVDVAGKRPGDGLVRFESRMHCVVLWL
jgi:hypothetical protein